MSAKNMKQLNHMLMKQVKRAMSDASEKILVDMLHNTGDFYAGTKPKKYDRTGALRRTPKTSDVVSSTSYTGGQASFDAYLDTDYQYTTGKKPSMEDVLNLANYGVSPSSPNHLRETVGKQGFWDNSVDNMEKFLDDAISKKFKKI